MRPYGDDSRNPVMPRRDYRELLRRAISQFWRRATSRREADPEEANSIWQSLLAKILG